MLCVSLKEIYFEKLFSLSKLFDFVELRLDDNYLEDRQLKMLIEYPNKKIITCRCFNTGYLDVYRTAICYGAEFIDIDCDIQQEVLNEMIILMRNTNTKLILSYHNFDTTPDIDYLREKVDRLFESGAHIVKIACKVEKPEDCANILSLYTNPDYQKRLIAIGMGEAGRISRISNLFLGAPFTYVSSGNGSETAEGQYDFISARDIIKRLEDMKLWEKL